MATASLHVWNRRDRDWTKRKYASKLAFRVMQNYMMRQSEKLRRAARRRNPDHNLDFKQALKARWEKAA